MPTTIARKRGALKRRTVKRVVSQKQKRGGGGGGVRTRGRGRRVRTRGRARVSRRGRVAVRSRRGGVGRKRFGGSGALNLYEQKPGEEDYVYLPPDETSVKIDTDANIEWCKRNVFAYNESGVPYLCSGKKQSPTSERYLDAIIPAHKEVLIDIKRYIELNQEALITPILSVSTDNLCPPFVYDSALFNEFQLFLTFNNNRVLGEFVTKLSAYSNNIHIVIRIGNILLAEKDLSSGGIGIIKWKALAKEQNVDNIKTRLRLNGYPKSKGLFITGTYTEALKQFDKYFCTLKYNLLLGSGFCMQYTEKTETYMHPKSDKLIANINDKLRTMVKEKGGKYIKMAAAMSGESTDYVSFDTKFGDCFPTIQFIGADMLSTQGTIFHPPSHHLQVFLDVRWFENEAKEHALTYFREQSQMPTLFVMMGGYRQVHNHAMSIVDGEMRDEKISSAPLKAVSIACFNGLKEDDSGKSTLTTSAATGLYFLDEYHEKLNEVAEDPEKSSRIQIIGMPNKENDDEYKILFSKFPTDYPNVSCPNYFKIVYEGLGKDDQGIGDALVDIFMEQAVEKLKSIVLQKRFLPPVQNGVVKYLPAIILNMVEASRKPNPEETKNYLKKCSHERVELRKIIQYDSIDEEYGTLLAVAQCIYSILVHDEYQYWSTKSNEHLNMIDILQELDCGYYDDVGDRAGYGAGVTAYYLRFTILKNTFKNGVDDIDTFVMQTFGDSTSNLFGKDGAKALISCGTFFKPKCFDAQEWLHWVNAKENKMQYKRWQASHDDKKMAYPSEKFAAPPCETHMWNIIKSIFLESNIYQYNKQTHRVEHIIPSVSMWWVAARGSADGLEYSKVVELARADATKPDLKALMARESCVDFPTTSANAGGARCMKVPKYEDVDLKQINLADPKQKQCTQLGFECDVCNLCVAFDGGLKPELDGKYHGFCNKKCRKPSTFMPVVCPSDLMGICYGFNGALISTYASMYAYNDKYIAVHDFGNLGPVHFLIIPTTTALPDVLSMCVDPVATGSTVNGPQLVAEMKSMALNIFRKMCGAGVQDDGLNTQYAPGLRAMGQIYGLGADHADEKKFWADGLPEKMLAIFNMPVSQNQLHLHIMLLPFFASQMAKAFQKNPFGNWCHWGWPRSVPFKLVERVVAGAGVEAGAGGTLMGEEEAKRIAGSGEGLENKKGSDWYKFCWRRLELAKEQGWTIKPFVEKDSARNDLLVLPLCFYHGAGESTIMTEWLGDEYRSKMETFMASLTESLAVKAEESKSGDEEESLQALVEANIDSKTGLIVDPDAYLRLLLKTAYMPPNPNVVSEYFARRLMCTPA